MSHYIIIYYIIQFFIALIADPFVLVNNLLSSETDTHTQTHPTYTSTIFYTYTYPLLRGITRWVWGGGEFDVRVYVRPARVRVRANRYMPRAESASPPPMGVPVCSPRGACAQVGASSTPPTAAHTPDPVRADAVATSAIRVRISTGSSPLHSDARGTHHFFSFSSFLFYSFPFRFSFSVHARKPNG